MNIGACYFERIVSIFRRTTPCSLFQQQSYDNDSEVDTTTEDSASDMAMFPDDDQFLDPVSFDSSSSSESDGVSDLSSDSVSVIDHDVESELMDERRRITPFHDFYIPRSLRLYGCGSDVETDNCSSCEERYCFRDTFNCRCHTCSSSLKIDMVLYSIKCRYEHVVDFRWIPHDPTMRSIVLLKKQIAELDFEREMQHDW